jgi:hypothetical protein
MRDEARASRAPNSDRDPYLSTRLVVYPSRMILATDGTPELSTATA